MKTKAKKLLTLGGAILTLGVLVNHLTEYQNVVEHRVVIIRNISYELPNFETSEKENDAETETELNTPNEEISEESAEETATEIELPEPMDEQAESPLEVKTEPIIVAEPMETEPFVPYNGHINENGEKYVLGFGYIPYDGENICHYAEDMYMNGNKVGIM